MKRPEELMTITPELLLKERERRGLSQQEAARQIGVGVATYGKWERGIVPLESARRSKLRKLRDWFAHHPEKSAPQSTAEIRNKIGELVHKISGDLIAVKQLLIELEKIENK